MATTSIHYVTNNTGSDQSDVNQYADILTGVTGAPGITVTGLTVTGSNVNFLPQSVQGSVLTGAITASGTTTNNITIAGSATTNPVTVTATGGDTNIGINAITKGTGTFQVSGSATANTLTMSGSAGGTGLVNFGVSGADTNLGFQFTPKNNSGLVVQGANNSIAIQGATAGNPVALGIGNVAGSVGAADATINIVVLAKGNTGNVQFGNAGANAVIAQGSLTGNAPSLSVGGIGSDTNITLQVVPKGTGSVALTNSLGNFVLQSAGSTSTQANYMVVNSAVAASSPGFTAAGSDTNVGIILTPQGTGTASAITVAGGRLLATGTACTAAAGANAGSSPPAPVVTLSNNTRGLVTWGSGTGPAAGAQVVVTFANGGFATAPFVQITEQTTATAAAALGGIYISNIGLTSFTISSVLAPAASQGNTIYGAYFSITG